MCRVLISHNNKVNMGATTIRTRIKAKGGVIIRIIKALRVMDGETIKTTCHHPRVSEPPSEKKVDMEQALAQILTSHTAFMNEIKANMQHQSTQLNN